MEKLNIDGSEYETRLTRKFERRQPYRPADPDIVCATIPGVIERVLARPGQKVRRGDSLLVLEAMKMKNAVPAPRDGTVASICVELGQMVARGQTLVTLQ